MDNIVEFLKRKDDYKLLEIYKKDKYKDKIERIYNIGIRFNLRESEIIYLLNEMLNIILGLSDDDIEELYRLI